MIQNSDNRVHLRVTGRVQGVGFRWFVTAEANRLGLAGWVRNNADGSVELEAEGALKAIEQLRERVRQGPPAARVERVVEMPVTSMALRRPFGVS